ncbi:hypothetical protein BC831DRAFT_1039 [Entophlyctis helioformis]|nr:hypothetical protein BC831DRAFT_1039 [Entophlyctis helioformis]
MPLPEPAPSPAPTVHISHYKPLPEEIMRMSETETACQYCGISYLLLSKYERMEKHVLEVDAEMARLKKYIEERPQMLSRLESLLALQKRLEEEWRTADAGMKEWQNRARKESENSERLMGVKKALEKEVERMYREARDRESQVQLQAASRARAINNLQYEVIQAQTDLAKLKGSLKSSMASVVLGALSAASKQLQSQFASVQQQAAKAAADQAERRSRGTIAALKKDVEALTEALNDSQKRNDRTSLELASFRQEYTSHIQGQKSYTQSLQANCLVLEERLNEATRNVMDMSNEREKYESEKLQLQKDVEALRQENDHIREDLEKKVLSLQTRLSREQMEHEKYASRMESTLKDRHFIGDSSQNQVLAQAQQSLARKDEQLLQMERSVRELNSNISALRNERIKTIEAHQNRIKQLQDRFVEELKTAGRDEVVPTAHLAMNPTLTDLLIPDLLAD